MNNIVKKLSPQLHMHVRSLYDADIDPQRLCNKIKELGGDGVAITDHGVVSSIEDYRRVFADNGLKLVPGCELYVDGNVNGRMHLIVIAKNDKGWQGIGKMVTCANRNLQDGKYPVIKEEDLFRIMETYKGDVICLSACMQGVINVFFLQNEHVDKKLAKLIKKQSAYVSAEGKELASAKKDLDDAKAFQDQAIRERDDIKRLAEAKFTARIKAVEKLEKKCDSTAFSARAELEADMKASKNAKEKLEDAKKKLDLAKKRVSLKNKEYKELLVSSEKWSDLQEQIDALSKEKKSDEELYALAFDKGMQYQRAFGKEYFYAEMQYHGIPQEKVCFPKLAKLAKELEMPFVATNDVHILENNENERLRRRILRSLRFGNALEDEFEGDSELYLKTDEELKKALLAILPIDVVNEAISNMQKVFDMCDVRFEHGTHYPKFSQEKDVNALLEQEVRKGIKWRFPEGMDKAHMERLSYELPIIENMGYADYHLIVKDFLQYGRLLGYVPVDRIAEAPVTIEELKTFIKSNGWKNPGFRIGPGRGSAAGSLVCYLLGITAIDPMDYGLLFERFLNPERISMPDIDVDISNSTRMKVVDYVRSKYGSDAVCQIMTQTFQQPKGAIAIAAKYYGLGNGGVALTSLGKQISKLIPSDIGTKFATKVNESGEVDKESKTNLYTYLLKQFEGDDVARNIIKWAAVVEGSFTAYSAHAAGIVISDNNDVSDYLPLRYNTESEMMTTQCDMVQVEENGLLKFDFLGLRTLDIITDAMFMIEKNHGVIIDPLKLDINDKDVYENILATGRTGSVFQFESSGMRNMLKRFKPTCFEDLIILVSMFRPGPLQYLDGVIDVKNGKAPMTFLCDELRPILGKTYGAIVYQEQVMEIFQKLAGYSLGGADMVRRYMSKKKHDKLEHERDAFINGDVSRGIKGCVANGISAEVANTLFEQMTDFASYAFNKSHAAAYAYNAYITAWLKYHYAPEFFAAALNWTTSKKLPSLMHEAKECGVEVKAPDINLSEKKFTVVDGEVRFGLMTVSGVKDHADDIIAERKNGAYTSVINFLTRAEQNSAVVEHLIDAGAFDSFHDNRKAMKEYAASLKNSISDIKKKTSFIKSAEFVLPKIEHLAGDMAVAKIQQDQGLKVEVKKMMSADALSRKLEAAKASVASLNKELASMPMPNVAESKSMRMALEKEYLGIYVTANPMDYYPSATEVGCDVIEDITCDSESAYGVVTNLSIKKRKKDGAEMAFFNLEDGTGSMEVCMFTRAYARFKDFVYDGAVLILQGHAQEEESEDEDDVSFKFFVDSVKAVSEEKDRFLMGVSSFESFVKDVEDAFKKMYEDEKGHPFTVYDTSTGKMYKRTYKVSDDTRYCGFEVKVC